MQSMARSCGGTLVSACMTEGGKGTTTYISSSDILHVCDVVVDDFKQPASFLGDVFDDVLKGLLGEALADSRRVDSSHAVVGSSLFVTLDSNLHGQATIEHHRNQAFNRHDFSDRGKRRIFSQGVAGERAISLDETLGTHILEAGLLHQGQSWLSELSSRQKTGRRPVGVGGGIFMNLLEDLLRLDRTISVDRFKGHSHVILADGLALGTTEVDGELLRIILDNVDDG